jgi:hypothetical protein
MRQMFSSPRLENVERVSQLLSEAGIENRVQGGRSYKGHSRRQFSYADRKANAAEQASVWVIKSDDYKRAREMMVELGLAEQSNAPSFLPEPLQLADQPVADTGSRLMRIKVALLFILGAGAAWMAFRTFLLR